MAAEMQRLRQQLEMAHVELICARAGGPSSSDVQVIFFCCGEHPFYKPLAFSQLPLLDLLKKIDIICL